MSRRKAASYVEIRCPDGLLVLVELPPEAMIREILSVIGTHARPTRRTGPRLLEQADVGNPL